MENILIEISDFILRIDKGVIKAQEAEDFFAGTINKVNNILIKDSDEQRIFDRWLNENRYIGRAHV